MAYAPPTWDNVSANFTEEDYTAPAWDAVAADLAIELGVEPLLLVGASSLGLGTSTPDLWFPWVGVGSFRVALVGDLTIHIELVGCCHLTFTAEPELTIGYHVQGVVTEVGAPVSRLLRVYRAATGAWLASGFSDAGNGSYFIDLHDYKEEVYVLCLGSSAYGPLAHGPVIPARR